MSTATPPELIHSAYFWLKKDLSAEDRSNFESELKLLTQIPYLHSGHAGAPALTPERPVTDHSFDYATNFHFSTLVDHDYYQNSCPGHARFVANCRQYFEKVIVYDVTPLS